MIELTKNANGAEILVGLTMRIAYRAYPATDGDSGIVFETYEGRRFLMRGRFEIKSMSIIEDLQGDLAELTGARILLAESVCFQGEGVEDRTTGWTFFKLVTSQGRVDVRWYTVGDVYDPKCVSVTEKKPSSPTPDRSYAYKDPGSLADQQAWLQWLRGTLT